MKGPTTSGKKTLLEVNEAGAILDKSSNAAIATHSKADRNSQSPRTKQTQGLNYQTAERMRCTVYPIPGKS